MKPHLSEDKDWLASLRPRFLELTAERLSELQKEQAALRTCDDPTETLKRLVDIAHKISGTAGSFGYVQIGDLAREVENSCYRFDVHHSLTSVLRSVDALEAEIMWVLGHT